MTIGIGFSAKTVALSRPPGWEPDSWGYHSDDGHCYAGQNGGKAYGPPFTASDVIGCGINFRTGCAFFTKNGHILGTGFLSLGKLQSPKLNSTDMVLLGTAFREIGKGNHLYPTIGLKKSGEHVRVNFGRSPFVFDIVGMMTVSFFDGVVSRNWTSGVKRSVLLHVLHVSHACSVWYALVVEPLRWRAYFNICLSVCKGCTSCTYTPFVMSFANLSSSGGKSPRPK